MSSQTGQECGRASVCPHQGGHLLSYLPRPEAGLGREPGAEQGVPAASEVLMLQGSAIRRCGAGQGCVQQYQAQIQLRESNAEEGLESVQERPPLLGVPAGPSWRVSKMGSMGGRALGCSIDSFLPRCLC